MHVTLRDVICDVRHICDIPDSPGGVRLPLHTRKPVGKPLEHGFTKRWILGGKPRRATLAGNHHSPVVMTNRRTRRITDNNTGRIGDADPARSAVEFEVQTSQTSSSRPSFGKSPSAMPRYA